MPQVPYLTMLDKYNVWNFSLLVILLVVLAILNRLPGTSQEKRDLDNTVFFVFAGITLALNVLFTVRSYLARTDELKQLGMNSKQLDRRNGKPKSKRAIYVSKKDVQDADSVAIDEPYLTYGKKQD